MENLQPWFIATIAGLGVLIAYFQWRTAHQRVVLDLFARRLEVFDVTENACSNIVAAGKATFDELASLHRAKSRARFLFRGDVNGYIKSRIADCSFLLAYTNDVINEHEGTQQLELIDRKYAALARISSFQNDAPPMFSRYMLLDQTMPGAWLPF